MLNARPAKCRSDGVNSEIFEALLIPVIRDFKN